jgi:serine/threonine protein kinase
VYRAIWQEHKTEVAVRALIELERRDVDSLFLHVLCGRGLSARHPNLLYCHGFVCEDPKHFAIVDELAETTLTNVMQDRSGRKWPKYKELFDDWQWKLRVLVETASALDFLSKAPRSAPLALTSLLPVIPIQDIAMLIIDYLTSPIRSVKTLDEDKLDESKLDEDKPDEDKLGESCTLVHGNVRSSSIFLRKDGSVALGKLMEHALKGITLTTRTPPGGGANTRTNGNHHTYCWMPPEMLVEPQTVSYYYYPPLEPPPWVDVYQLGMVMYELLTREPPFYEMLHSQVPGLVRHIRTGAEPILPSSDESASPSPPPPPGYTELMRRCWHVGSEPPERRLTVSGLLSFLKKMLTGETQSLIDEASATQLSYRAVLDHSIKKKQDEKENVLCPKSTFAL